jgi:hypothetical protein
MRRKGLCDGIRQIGRDAQVADDIRHAAGMDDAFGDAARRSRNG